MNTEYNDGLPLAIAARLGHCDMMKKLLTAGADVNTSGHQSEPALIAAAKCGQERSLQLLLKEGADVNIFNSCHQFTAVKIAKQNKQFNCVAMLIRAGADPEGEIVCNRLLLSIENDDIHKIRHLLKTESDINSQDHMGNTALLLAVKHKRLEVVKLLIQSGARIDVINKMGEHPVSIAVSAGLHQILEELLQAGADVNSLGKRKGRLPCLLGGDSGEDMSLGDIEPPLITAAKFDRVACLRSLLENGADPYIKDKNCNTALYFALRENHFECINFLLQAQEILGKGKILNVVQESGLKKLPTRQAKSNFEKGKIYNSDTRGCSESPKKKKSDESYSSTQSEGNTAECRQDGCLQFLLDREARENLSPQLGVLSPLFKHCAEKGKLTTLRWLLSIGQDINVQDNNGNTALMLAIKNKQTETLKLLIQKGANVNILDCKGESPLSTVIQSGDYERDVVTLLVQAGAYVDSSTSEMMKETGLQESL